MPGEAETASAWARDGFVPPSEQGLDQVGLIPHRHLWAPLFIKNCKSPRQQTSALFFQQKVSNKQEAVRALLPVAFSSPPGEVTYWITDTKSCLREFLKSAVLLHTILKAPGICFLKLPLFPKNLLPNRSISLFMKTDWIQCQCDHKKKNQPTCPEFASRLSSSFNRNLI